MLAEPTVQATHGGADTEFRGRVVRGGERSDLWRIIRTVTPIYELHQRRTSRDAGGRPVISFVRYLQTDELDGVTCSRLGERDDRLAGTGCRRSLVDGQPPGGGPRREAEEHRRVSLWRQTGCSCGLHTRTWAAGPDE